MRSLLVTGCSGKEGFAYNLKESVLAWVCWLQYEAPSYVCYMYGTSSTHRLKLGCTCGQTGLLHQDQHSFLCLVMIKYVTLPRQQNIQYYTQIIIESGRTFVYNL